MGHGRNKLFQFSGGARLNATVRVSVLALRLVAGVGDPSSGLAHRAPGLLHPQPWMFEAESSGLSRVQDTSASAS